MDARFLTHPQPGGFKTYTENLISALTRVDSENEYFLYTDRPFGSLIDSLHNSNFHGCVVSSELPVVGSFHGGSRSTGTPCKKRPC